MKTHHSNLQNVLKALENNYKEFNEKYYIPSVWNAFDFTAINTETDHSIEVQPYDYYMSAISYILDQSTQGINYQDPLSKINNESNHGDWVKSHMFYSMMIRTSTSYDHTLEGNLNNDTFKKTGTFLKTIALLPLLQKMGINVLYLLPISQFSLRDKKGDLGSPYGVSNFYKLDPALKDNLTGNDTNEDIEFSALVEAAHILGMRVMIDIIPRTNAIENDFIIDHPDWFYWIKYSELDQYTPPKVEGLGETISPVHNLMEQVYHSQDVKSHIARFMNNPSISFPTEWEMIREQVKKDPSKSILDLTRSRLDMTVAPAFSDHINDPQPPWSDITFFRMYEDHPKQTIQYLDDPKTPPYILFDTIKNNYYQGEKPNKELWDSLSGIIPHFQQHYGIDGARIDMGHALSNELIEMIVGRAKAIDPNFAFIAEDLNPGNDVISKEKGYNMIIGNGFAMLSKVHDRHIVRFIELAKKMIIPMFAAGETHDTPRLSARDGGTDLSKFITILNMFIPNTVPFINSGQELYEISPMNTGLDCRENEAFLLDKEDPYYGKLALFDKYQFHYNNNGISDFINLISYASSIRNQYMDILQDVSNSYSFEHNDGIIQIEYNQPNTRLIILANPVKDYASRKSLHFYSKDVKLLLSTNPNYDIIINDDKIETTIGSFEMQLYIIK